MVYSFALFKHANIRYREAFIRLARCELSSMLRSLSIHSDLSEEEMGGSLFLTFESRRLSDRELSFLSLHSSVVFMAEKQEALLLPLNVVSSYALPEELPEVLKYKGKTNSVFSRMMLNTAFSLASSASGQEPPLFFDPICGKGTGCFCAVIQGMNAVGLDIDRKAVHEAVDYFSKYLRYHKLKHHKTIRSETYKNRSLPVSEFQFFDSREHFRDKESRCLQFCTSDTSDSPALFRRRKADVITADLPYGIQFAPLASQKPEALSHFLQRSLPVWKSVLRPGGAIALSFNTLTLPSDVVRDSLMKNGFTLPEDACFSGLQHEVEQAVIRDVLFAYIPEEDTSK